MNPLKFKKEAGLTKTLVNTMRVSTTNMTTGSPVRHMLIFAAPLLIGNIFQLIYNIADLMVIGRFLGVHALAAIGSTNGLFFMITGFTAGSSTGLTLITAQRFGANDYEGVKRSVATSVIITIAITAIIMAITIPFIPILLILINTPAEILYNAHLYLLVITIGLIAASAFNYFPNLIRALGDSRTPLLFLIIGMLSSIPVLLLCVVVLNLGVAGVAIAMLFSWFATSVLCLIKIRKSLPILKTERRHWRIQQRELIFHLKKSLPIALQTVFIATGAIILQFAVNQMGAIAIAAHSTASRIQQIGLMPLFSIALAVGTFVAQNHGAGEHARIRSGVKQMLFITVVAGFAFALVNIFGGPFITNAIVGTSEIDVIRLTQQFLTLSGLSYFALGILVVLRFTLQGMGRNTAPFLSGVAEFIAHIIVALVLIRFFGFLGAIWISPIAWIGGSLPLIIAYGLYIRKMKAGKGV